MRTFVSFLVLAVAVASAGHLGLGHWGHAVAVAPVHHNPAAHIPSGSVSVGPNGAIVAGPAGSVSTDNGLHSGRAGARLAGASGTVGGWGAHGVVEGPAGVAGAHHGGWGAGVVVAAPVWGHGAWGHGGWGHDAWGHGVHGAWGHGVHGVVSHGLHGHGW